MSNRNDERHITIRPASMDDFEAIYTLNRDGLGYDFALEETRGRLRYILQKTENRLLVAEAAGAVVGYIQAADYECTYVNSLKNVLALVVDEQAQGCGVGRALLTAVEEWARETGACGVRLVSGANREKSHHFYLACGYRIRKEQKNFIKLFFE